MVGIVFLHSLLDECVRLREVVDDTLRCVILDVSQDHVDDALTLVLGSRMRRHCQDVRDSTPLQSLPAISCGVTGHIDARMDLIYVVLWQFLFTSLHFKHL